MQKILLTVFSLALLSVVFLGSNVLAAPASNSQEALDQLNAAAGSSGAGIAGSGHTEPQVIVAKIIKTALSLIGIIFVVLILYAGFLWMTAGGEEEKTSKAKKLIFNGVIGLVIILSAYALTSFVVSRLTDATTGGSSYGDSQLPAPEPTP